MFSRGLVLSMIILTVIWNSASIPSPPGAAFDREKQKLASLQQLSDAFDKLPILRKDSYQVFLRNCHWLLVPALIGQECSDIKSLFQERKITRNSPPRYCDPDSMDGTYTLQEKAILLPSGHSLELRLDLYVKDRNIWHAEVKLVSKLAAPYPQIWKERLYPKESVLDNLLAEVGDLGAEWPVLDDIEVSYCHLCDHYTEYNPFGFMGSVMFVASISENVASKTVYFNAASGLDPLRTYSGELERQDGFKSQDTVADFRSNGGHEGWSGTPQQIHANKVKCFGRLNGSRDEAN